MKIGIQLLKLMEKKAFAMYPEDFKPVDRKEILDFAKQYDISLRDDHLDFMVKYGNSYLLKIYYGKISFESFKEYYIEENNYPDIKQDNLKNLTPPGTSYFGILQNREEILIIKNKT